MFLADQIARIAKIISGIGALAVDPTGTTSAALTGANVTADSYLGLREILAASRASEETARQIEIVIAARLTAPDFHLPKDGILYLSQMIELAVPTPSELVSTDLSQSDPQVKADRLLAILTAKLPAEYTRRVELTEAFRNLLRPIYADLFASDRFLTENAPVIARETHARLVAMADSLLHLSQTYGSLAKSLDDLRQLRRSDLEALAFRFGQAAPRMLSSPVLLFHCLGAIFGSKNLDEHLPDELIDRARELLSTRLDTRVVPHGALIIRRAENPDALGSFMRASPNGLLPDELNPSTVRESLIDDALNSLEANGPDAVAGWWPFAAFACGGLSADEQRRFIKLLRAADLWSVGFEGQQPKFIYWRALLAPAAAFDPDWAKDKLIELAHACRRNFTPQDQKASEALGELAETATMLAAASYSADGRITFEDLLRRIAVAWPECVPVLRNIVDNLLTYTPVSRSRQLWELHLLLRTFQ